MSPELSNGQITQLVQSFAKLEAKFDSVISDLVRKDVYASDQRGTAHQLENVRDDVREVKGMCEEIAKNRREDRRLIFTAIAAPICLLIVQLYLRSQGAL